MSDQQQQQQTPAELDPANMTRDQFTEALRQARAEGGKTAAGLVAEMGYTGPLEGFGDWRKQQAATLAEAQAKREQIEREAAAHAATAGRSQKVLETYTKSALASLTPEQRQAVQERAGDDLVKQAEALELLHAAGLTTRSRRPAAARQAAAPGTPPAPKPPQSAWQTWRQMQATDPKSAARFFEQHRVAITNSSPNK